jgi:ankyrin repeat protein
MTTPPTEEMIRAIRSKDASAMCGLIEAGFDTAWKDAEGRSLLHFAAAMGSEDLVVLLTNKGIPALSFSNDEETPADYARMFAHQSITEFLNGLEKREMQAGKPALPFASIDDMHAQVENGRHPMHRIVRMGLFPQMVDMVVSRGEKFNADDLLNRGRDGSSVLEKICRMGQLDKILTAPLWQNNLEDFAKVWTEVPAKLRKTVDHEAFIAQVRRQKLQPRAKNQWKPK